MSCNNYYVRYICLNLTYALKMSKKSRNTADQIYMKAIAISKKINNFKEL